MTADELRARFPNASEAFITANADKNYAGRLPPAKPQRPEGQPLERPAPGEASGRSVTSPRHRIRFTIYSVHPCDWDGYHIKELQDMLVRAAILPDDNWGFLQGEIVSEKAHTKADERTEITIEECVK